MADPKIAGPLESKQSKTKARCKRKKEKEGCGGVRGSKGTEKRVRYIGNETKGR